MTTEATDTIVEIRNLSRIFGKTHALNNVSLDIPRGGVFGLVGENGAGKTTLIKHILGLYKPQQGHVRVFGADPIRDPETALGKIGYLSEDRDLPGWMRVEQLLQYSQSFYPGWDQRFAGTLIDTFGLDRKAKIRNLSRGQKAQAGLVAAMGHKPDLLLLDEPSSGLDAVVRRDILGAIIRTVADEGRTVLFSSHLLDEVERVADSVAMVYGGTVLPPQPLEDLKANYRHFTLRFEAALESPPQVQGALSLHGMGREWSGVHTGSLEELQQAVGMLNAELLEERTASLEDIFVAQVNANRRNREAETSGLQEVAS